MSSSTYLSYQEAADLLRVSRATLYSWVYERRIPHVRLSSRTVRFIREDLDRWMELRRINGNEDR